MNDRLNCHPTTIFDSMCHRHIFNPPFKGRTKETASPNVQQSISGLRLYLPPFAPDTSGAASVLYPLGGLVVIVDAGGCAGNICGFDEPRAHLHLAQASVMASAGLRDMDAIMGRDDRLLAKLAQATQNTKAGFIALVGTPVPAVIGTDLKALARLAEKQTGLPCLAVAADGTQGYDKGASAAYLALVQKYAKASETIPKRLGVLGVTPLDFTSEEQKNSHDSLTRLGWDEALLLGLDAGRADFENIVSCERLMVVSPAGLPAAEYLQEKFGVPFFTGCPLGLNPRLLQEINGCLPAGTRRLLIIQQQFAGNALRNFLQVHLPETEIVCGTFFELCEEYVQHGDLAFREESDFQAAAQDFDAIIGDHLLQRALPQFSGTWIDYPHFAISGKLY